MKSVFSEKVFCCVTCDGSGGSRRTKTSRSGQKSSASRRCGEIDDRAVDSTLDYTFESLFCQGVFAVLVKPVSVCDALGGTGSEPRHSVN